MKNCMLTFRSVTPAQRAEELLHRAGVDCTIQRTPKYLEDKGCGYSIRLDCATVTQAVVLLRNGGIPFRKVYAYDDETPKEMRV